MPVAEGVKTRYSVTVPPLAATLIVPLSCAAKSAAFAPVSDNPVIWMSAVPVFVTVAANGELATPFNCVPKSSELGLSVMVEGSPFPESATL